MRLPLSAREREAPSLWAPTVHPDHSAWVALKVFSAHFPPTERDIYLPLARGAQEDPSGLQTLMQAGGGA